MIITTYDYYYFAQFKIINSPITTRVARSCSHNDKFSLKHKFIM